MWKREADESMKRCEKISLAMAGFEYGRGITNQGELSHLHMLA